MRSIKYPLTRTLAIFRPETPLMLLWATSACAWLMIVSPFFYYGYDWDPGDGDVLNVVIRLARGLPIYGDWARGEIMSLYPPMSHAFYALLLPLGIDPLKLSRTLNALMIVASSFLVIQFVLSEITCRSSRLGLALLAGILQLSVWPQYRAAVNFRPDPPVLFLSLLALYTALYRSNRVLTAAVLAALCVMTKQSGFSVILGSLTFYNNRAQTNVGRYLAPLGVTLIVLILWFEAKNGGNFIRSIAWYPAFSLAGPSQLDWNHLAGLWSAFYFGKYFWILPLLGFSLVSAIRRKSIALLSLYVTYAADLAFNLHAGQHLGAGGPYLWFNWHLTSILVAIGLGELVFILFISFKNRFPVRALMTPFVIVFFLLITKNNLVPLLNEPPEKLVGMAIKAGRAQDEVIAKMVGQSTEASWASVRSPTSILKNGFVLDREFCSLNGSLSLAGSKNSATQTIISDLRTGKYNYFQTGFPYSCGSIPGVEEALRDCWTFIAYGNVTFYGIQLQTEILKYKGYCTQSAGDST